MRDQDCFLGVVFSVEGATRCRKQRVVATDEFGETTFTGKIALLHIDGNHEESAVEADVQAWAGLVVKGGWIVFDDYKWPYGDGPRCVADRYIGLQGDRVQSACFSGGALFVKAN